MTRVFLFLISSSVVSLSGWLIGFGYSFQWLSFTVGLGIFTTNLALWTLVVGQVLKAAAESALAQQGGAEEDKRSGAMDTDFSEGCQDPDVDRAEVMERTAPRSRRSWFMVVSMVFKMAFFCGGIYFCLAYWRLSPMYFVAGLIVGLLLTAISAFGLSTSSEQS